MLMRSALALTFLFSWNMAHATITSCTIPLDESKSSPAIDVIQNGASVDRDILLEQIRHGFDSSTLEPQLSDLYRGTPQPLTGFPQGVPYPAEGDTVNFTNQLAGVDMLVRGRVTLANNPNIAFQLNFSLDQHAAMARNALLRRLGYAIASPKHYTSLKVRFNSLDERNSFIESVGGDTITARARWLVGGQAEADGTDLVVNFQDLVLEPAVIAVPQLHWGILTTDTINSRRSIRALLVPLTLLDLPESVNRYSFEPARIYNEGISFSRTNADKFNNETSIGDVRWITKKIAKLTRTDWTNIIQAGGYPADLQALIVEKTIGRVDQLMKLLQIRNFTQIPYNEYVTSGSVINGKATQENYTGHAERWSYGDPQNPLRAAELGRFFGIELLNNGLTYVLNKANNYFQVLTPQRYIDEHGQKFIDDLNDHFTKHPGEPFIQPISIFGGMVAGGKLDATRSIVTGTYYGSDSPVQLVDSVSAAVTVGGFFGVSGLRTVGISGGPSVQYSRNYVHVRPLTSIQSAWKDNWKNVMVPYSMSKLAKVLAGDGPRITPTPGPDGTTPAVTPLTPAEAMTAFFSEMKTGEMLIISDGLSSGAAVDVKIPLGATLGLISPYSNITADVSAGVQYAILSRTTIVKTGDGLHVYLSRIHSGSFQAEVEADFFIKVIDLAAAFSKGKAHTSAYALPETFTSDTDSKNFQNALLQILRRNNPNEMEADFKPYELDHSNNGSRTRLSIGPWTWSSRQNMHKLEITPPIDAENRYNAAEQKRTVFQGQTTKINGTDLFGFFGGLLHRILPFINLGGGQLGDDPSSNFLGKSHTFTASTEIETTPGRNNRPFTKLQQAFTGWSLSKARLMRLLGKISEQIGEFNPSGGLIDPSEFAQTRKVQAFTILWNLLVYEQGSKNVLTILDMAQTSTKQAQDFLIKLEGEQEYTRYCRSHELEPGLQTGPYDYDGETGTRSESAQGQTTYIGCVTPMMSSVYELRASLSDHPEVFRDVRDEEDAKSKIRWTNRIFVSLNNNLELAQIIRWVGKDNSFFQVRLSGFRVHDENADFRSAYYSNTIGLIDQEVLGGPTADIESITGISSHEIEARYLSDGY